MKEFVEKLIGRLEEEKNKAEERYHKYLDDDNYCNLPCVFTIADIVQDKVEVLTEVKEIVNQLAEEYKEKDCSKCSRRSWYQKGYADAEKNNGWIPVSERLPKDEELSQRKEVIVQNRYGEIFTANYTYNCPKTRKDFFKEYCIVPYVVAWMPLPSPYQKEGE